MKKINVKARQNKKGIIYEYSFEIASVDGKRKRKTKSGFLTKTDALEAGLKAYQEYEQLGRIVEYSKMSYADFLDKWIENDIKLNCKTATVNNYEKKIRLYIKPALGEYMVKNLTKEQLQSFVTDMYNKGFSVNTISSVRGILSKSLNWAEDNNYISKSPANRLVTPYNMQPEQKTREKPHVYIPQDVIDKIFERFPEGSSAYIPLQLAYHCGLRLGEIHGVVWEDIDFDRKLLKINRQVQWSKGTGMTEEERKLYNGTSHSNGFWYFAEPKYRSYGIIDLDDEIIDILKKEREKQVKAEAYYAEYYSHYYCDQNLNITGYPPEYKVLPINKIGTDKTQYEVNFVCRREDGTFVDPRVHHHVSQIIHRQIGFTDYDTHSMRHTHATMLRDNGADMTYIMQRLRHKDLKITMGLYANHQTELSQAKNQKLINDIFKQDNMK